MPYAVRRCGIYEIRRIGTDERYIGQSVNIALRFCRHRRALEIGNHHSPRLQRAFAKYGIDAFSFLILEEGLDPTDKVALTIAEQKWFDLLNPCFNAAPAAGSPLGYRWSDEARAKASNERKTRFGAMTKEERAQKLGCKKGSPSPWKGRSPSEETRAKMRAAKLGKPSPNRGIPKSEEQKRKQSLALLGRPSPNKGITRSPEANAKQSASMKALWAKKKEFKIVYSDRGCSG